jgi:hypothetical protein
VALKVGLRFEESVNMIMPPRGLPDHAARGSTFRNPANKAMVLVLHTKTWADQVGVSCVIL